MRSIMAVHVGQGEFVKKGALCPHLQDFLNFQMSWEYTEFIPKHTTSSDHS